MIIDVATEKLGCVHDWSPDPSKLTQPTFTAAESNQ